MLPSRQQLCSFLLGKSGPDPGLGRDWFETRLTVQAGRALAIVNVAVLLAGCAATPGPDASRPERGEAEAVLQRLQSDLNHAHALTGDERVRLVLGSAKSRTAHALDSAGVLAAFMVMGQQDAVGFWNVEVFREREADFGTRAEARCALYARRIEDPAEIDARNSDLMTSLGECEGEPELIRLLAVFSARRHEVR